MMSYRRPTTTIGTNFPLLNWVKLAELEQQLRDVSEARRLNAQLRNHLRKQLVVVECEISAQQARSDSSLMYYEENIIWGVTPEEMQKLVQMFWGKNRTETNREVSKTEKRAEKLSKSAQRTCFVNGMRTARQRCLAVQAIDPAVRVKTMFARPNLFSLDTKFSMIDATRLIVFNAVFEKNIPIRRLYPWINLPKLSAWINGLQAVPRPLADFDIDADRLQQQIRLYISEAERQIEKD